jgi:hypothetical protein
MTLSVIPLIHTFARTELNRFATALSSHKVLLKQHKDWKITDTAILSIEQRAAYVRKKKSGLGK